MLRILTLATACIVITACGDDSPMATLPLPSPIPGGEWRLQSANDLSLPAKISERSVGVAIEESYLDSAKIFINDTTGTWEQRAWIRVLHMGVEDRRDLMIDMGYYQVNAAGTNFSFSSDIRSRNYDALLLSPALLRTSEPLLFYVGAEPIIGLYLLSH